MEVIGFIASFGIGFILGLMGGGGSIMCIPILVYLFSVPVVEATAYSSIIVGVTCFVGALHRLKYTSVDLRVGLIFGLPSILSIYCTRRWLIPSIPDTIWQYHSWMLSKRSLILLIFSILVISSSYFMIVKKINPTIVQSNPKRFWLIVHGALVGFITGLVGVGGGFIILPSLIFFSKLSFNTAVGTTLLIIALKSFFAFLADISMYTLNWSLLSKILILTVFGILLGNKLSAYVPGAKLKIMFGWFTLAVGISIILSELILVK